MAELNTGDSGGKDKKVRSKKANSKVDLTAMVDLAFLLITFFMLTTSLSKPQSMDLALPDKTPPEKKEIDVKVDENRTITLLLGENNKLIWYKGFFEKPLAGKESIEFGKNGLRKMLLKQKAEIIAYTQDKTKGPIVIIKPSKKSKYKNLVDALDEMAISGIEQSAIVNDYTPEEKTFLEGK
jgi:biopolymer transport protein ExbD